MLFDLCECVTSRLHTSVDYYLQAEEQLVPIFHDNGTRQKVRI